MTQLIGEWPSDVSCGVLSGSFREHLEDTFVKGNQADLEADIALRLSLLQ